MKSIIKSTLAAIAALFSPESFHDGDLVNLNYVSNQNHEASKSNC